MNALWRRWRELAEQPTGIGQQNRWPPGLAALATVAVLAGAVAVASAVSALVAADGLAWLIVFQVAVLAQVVWLAGAFGGAPRHVLSLVPPRGGLRVVWPAVAALGVFATLYAALVFAADRAALMRDLSQAASLARSDAWLLVMVAIGIGAPLSEEMLFRGFLFPALARSRLGLAGAALVSTLAWTTLHAGYSLYGLVEVFLVGLYFSWLVVRTGSLWVPILCHAIYNTAIMLGLRWLPIPL